MTPEIYIINLERSTLRRTHLQKRLDELSLTATFVSAVDGNQLSPDEIALVDPVARSRLGYPPLTPPEIGCYLSHLRLWQKIAAGNSEWAVIFEDDLLLDDDLPSVLMQIGKLHNKWDCIRLAGLYHTPSLKLDNIGQDRSLNLLLNTACGAQAYCLSKRGAEKLLAKATPIVRPVDNMIDRYWENGLIILAVQPYPIQQNEKIPSDIGGARRLKAPSGKGNIGIQQWWKRRVRKWHDSFAKRKHNLALYLFAWKYDR